MKKISVFLLLVVPFIACQLKGSKHDNLQVGAAQINEYLPHIKGKRIGLVVNQTSLINNTHLVDSLLELDVNITSIFAPEHGFRGDADAGEHVSNGIDIKTKLPIISLYGKHKKPTIEDYANVDIILFDIQDVGVRFYTYISTLHYVMEACAEQNKQIIVLDRPNPNGFYVAGPVLEMEYQSFVGMHPIPIVHGLTIGELAQMINVEGWLKNEAVCDLDVIKIKNYTHETKYSLPVKPSPNLPNDRAIALYPSLCLFEPTIMSIGRGTDAPFQLIGFTDSNYGDFKFTPVSTEGASKYPKHQDRICYGEDLRTLPNDTHFTLKWLLNYFQKNDSTTFITSESFFDKLVGNSTMRAQLIERISEKEIEASWQQKLEVYKNMRKKYLLYPDIKVNN